MSGRSDSLGAMCHFLVMSNPDVLAAGVCVDGQWLALYPEAAELECSSDVSLVIDGELSDEAFASAEQLVATTLKRRKRMAFLEGEVVALDRTEHKLRRREMELNGLVDGAPMAIFVLGPDGEIRFVNQFVESLVRRDREDLLGESAARAHAIFDVSESVAHVISEERPIQVERSLDTSDGTATLLQDSFPLRGADGEVGAICVVAQDISLRKASEIALAESERNYREVFDRSTDLIILSSIKTGEVLDVNSRVETLLGFSKEEWKAQPKWMSSAVEMGEGVDLSLNLLHEAAEHPLNLEWPLRHKDGSVRWFELQLSRTSISGQTLVMVVGRDIQKRKLEERRRVMLEENVRRSQKFDALGRLAGGVAQEFNDLLGAILSYSDLLKRELQSSLLREDVQHIQEAASRAAHLSRKLLVLGNRDITRPQRLQLNDSIRAINELLQKALGSEVRFAVNLADVPPVMIDPVLFDQILVNLTVHAREAMGTRGRFEITTSLTEPPEGRRLREAKQVVCVRVTDSGPAIPPESVEYVFEPYFSRTGVKKADSQGLGLALVHSIVDRAGGDVRVVSTDDGAQFELYFPIAQRDADQDHTDAATILVVEDEPGVLALVRRILEARGYTILTASNGDEAMTVMKDSRVDLMLTDVVMPGISGPELAAQVRETRPDFAVLFMSGYPDNVIGPDWAHETAHDLLLKPFTAKSLVRAIEGRLASLI